MSTLQIIQSYWPIILFCGSVIASWVRYEMQINTLKDCLGDVDREMDKINARITVIEKSQDTFRETVQVTLAQINTNLDYIKEFIKEIKSNK